MIQSLGPNTWLSRAKIVALGLAAASLCHPSAGAEDAGTAPRAAMTDAMARMMEAMSMFFQPAAPGLPLANPLPPLGAMPGTLPKLPGSMPWSSSKDKPGDLVAKGGEMIEGIAEGMANMGTPGGQLPWLSDSRLDGVWEGRGGELLIVQGNRFRIYPGSTGYVEGYIQTRGDRLALYNPENANISPFEFAESEGRLALRDSAGTLILYRRIWQDQPKPASAPATPPPSTPQK